MKRFIYLRNGQSLDLFVSPLKKSRPRYISALKNLLCNKINWVSQIEEQKKIIKNNEEKNPKLLFVHVHVVDAMLACRLCIIHIIMRASASSLWYKMCTQDFLTNMAGQIDQKKIDTL